MCILPLLCLGGLLKEWEITVLSKIGNAGHVFLPLKPGSVKRTHFVPPVVVNVFFLSSSVNQSCSCQMCFAASLGCWFPRLWHMVCKKTEELNYIMGGRHIHIPSAFTETMLLSEKFKVSPQTHRSLDSGYVLWWGREDNSGGNTERDK